MSDLAGAAILADVNSSNITREQAAAMGRVIGRHLHYLNKLVKRLDRVGFSPTDPLYLAAHRAFDGVHGLSVNLHYLSCPPGTAGDCTRGAGRG